VRGSECCSIRMADSMRVNGGQTSVVVEAMRSSQMARSISGSTPTIKRRAKGFILGQMEKSMRVSGTEE
jgi:hypothetical protein